MGKLIVPREHGAWAMLLVPFLVGIGVNGFAFNLPVLLTAGLALALFLARYPLTLLVKYPQRKNSYIPSLLLYLGAAGVLAVPLLVGYKLYALIPMGVLALVFLGSNLWLTARGHERSLSANLLGITGLSLTAPLAYYVSSGPIKLLSLMLTLWIVCSLFFGSSLFYVKMLFRESKNPYFREAALTVHLLGLVVTVAGVLTGLAPLLLPLAFIPPLVKVVIAIRRSGTPSLRQIGFQEIAYSLVFLVLTIISFTYLLG
ncbi:MAG TPA: YwiC-like family protein [Verrucomicrobiae bacterium]|nr:YwiC-like family protein [Verrucomicrobiae bacterium]